MSGEVESPGGRFISITTQAGAVEIETVRIGGTDPQAPLIVFLHEGLGSVSMWRQFPATLCMQLGWQGLMYSRPGYGRSTPCARDAIWSPDYMHDEALRVLPEVLSALDIDGERQPVWLLGHSDGGSIALIHAAHASARLAGAVVLAPHILVEALSVRSIELARKSFLDGSLRTRLARHHRDPEATFMRWNRTWLSAAFRAWSIEDEIAAIRCPLLAVQGLEDPYGTLEQIHGIARRVPGTRVVEIAACGHSPHRDHPARLIDEVAGFVRAQPGSH